MPEKQSVGERKPSGKEIANIVVNYRDGTKVSCSPVQFVELLARKVKEMQGVRK